jgi:hypothetical protein
MLNDDELAQLVSAIAQTPQFQFLDQLMAEQQATATESATFGEEAPEEEFEEPADEGLEDFGGEEVPAGGPEPAGEEPGLGEGPGEEVDDLADINDLLVEGDEGEQTGAFDEVPEEDDEAQQNIAPLAAGLMGGAAGMMAGRASKKNEMGEEQYAADDDPKQPTFRQKAKGIGKKAAKIGAIGAGTVAAGTLAHKAAFPGSANFKKNMGVNRMSKQASGQQPVRAPVGNAETVTPEQYAALRSSHNQLVKEHGALAERLGALLREKTDAERIAALEQLRGRFPHFVDMEEEVKAVCYSAGANMSDEQFGAHLERVEKYAHRADMAARVAHGDIPEGTVDRGRNASAQSDKYTAELGAEVKRVHTEAANRGEHLTFEQCKTQALKNLGMVATQ